MTSLDTDISLSSLVNNMQLNVQAHYPGHADLESTSFPSSSSNAQIHSPPSGSSYHTTFKTSANSPPRAFARRQRPQSLSGSFSGSGQTMLHDANLESDDRKLTSSAQGRNNFLYSRDGNNTSRSFVVQPFEASIEIATSFQSELDRLYSESKQSYEDDDIGETRTRKSAIVYSSPEDDQRLDGVLKPRPKSVILSDEIVIVSDDEQDFATFAAPPPPPSESPTDENEESSDNNLGRAGQESNPSGVVARGKISLDKSSSLSCLQLDTFPARSDQANNANARPNSFGEGDHAQSILSKSDGFDSLDGALPNNQQMVMSGRKHLSLPYQTIPEKSFFGKFMSVKKHHQVSLAIGDSLSNENSSAYKSFSFSHPFGKSKKKKHSRHKWKALNCSEVKPREDICTWCNRPFDTSTSQTSVVICQNCGLAVHEEDACKASMDNTECSSKRRKNSIVRSKRQLSGRSPSLSSLIESNRNPPLSVTSSVTSSAIDHSQILNGSIMEEDERDGGQESSMFDFTNSNNYMGDSSLWRHSHARSISAVTESSQSNVNSSQKGVAAPKTSAERRDSKKESAAPTVAGVTVGRTKSTPNLSQTFDKERLVADPADDVDSLSNAQRFRLDLRTIEEKKDEVDLRSVGQRWDETVPEKVLSSMSKYTVQEQSAILEFLNTEVNFRCDLDIVDLYIYNIVHVIDWNRWNVARSFKQPPELYIAELLFGEKEVRGTLRSLSSQLVNALNEERLRSRSPGKEGDSPSYVMDVSSIVENHFCDEDNINRYVNAFHSLAVSHQTAKAFYDDAIQALAEFRKFSDECSKAYQLKRRAPLDTRDAIMQRPYKYSALFASLLKSAEKQLDSEGSGSSPAVVAKVERLKNCQSAIDSILSELNKQQFQFEQAVKLNKIWSKTDNKAVVVNLADSGQEKPIKFEKIKLEELSSQLGQKMLNTFTVKLAPQEVKEKSKNVLILAMERGLVLLEIKDFIGPQYALFSAPKQAPYIQRDTLIVKPSETLNHEQVHLIDKKGPCLSAVTFQSRTERNEFLSLCYSIIENSKAPPVGNANSLQTKSHSFKSSSFASASSGYTSKRERKSSQSKHQNPTGQDAQSISSTSDNSSMPVKQPVFDSNSSFGSSYEALNDSFTTGTNEAPVNPIHKSSTLPAFPDRKSSALGVRVEACYDQLNRLFNALNHQTLIEGDSLKQSISSLMSELSNLKTSHQLSPLQEGAQMSVSRSESCKPTSLNKSLFLDASNDQYLTSSSTHAGQKRPLSFTDLDSIQKGHLTSTASFSPEFEFKSPAKREVTCTCGGGALEYISELEEASNVNKTVCKETNSRIARLQVELEKTQKDLLKSKRQALDLQLNSLMKENKRTGEFKRFQENLDSVTTHGQGKETAGEVVECSCDCGGDYICHEHMLELTERKISRNETLAEIDVSTATLTSNRDSTVSQGDMEENSQLNGFNSSAHDLTKSVDSTSILKGHMTVTSSLSPADDLTPAMASTPQVNNSFFYPSAPPSGVKRIQTVQSNQNRKSTNEIQQQLPSKLMVNSIESKKAAGSSGKKAKDRESLYSRRRGSEKSPIVELEPSSESSGQRRATHDHVARTRSQTPIDHSHQPVIRSPSFGSATQEAKYFRQDLIAKSTEKVSPSSANSHDRNRSGNQLPVQKKSHRRSYEEKARNELVSGEEIAKLNKSASSLTTEKEVFSL